MKEKMKNQTEKEEKQKETMKTMKMNKIPKEIRNQDLHQTILILTIKVIILLKARINRSFIWLLQIASLKV